MKFFLIKGFKGKVNDKFMMESSEDFILFVAYGLKDLEETLKGILAKGYRIRNKETLSRRLKEWGGIEIRSVFGIPMVEIKEVDFRPNVENEILYYNPSRNSSYEIKTTKTEYW